MRICLLMVLVLYSVLVAGQKDNASARLYYFKSKGLVGVKDATGRIIIPAKNHNFLGRTNGELITTDLINLYPKDDTSEKQSFGVTYNRKGEPLFRPFLFDNGPDDFREGRCRFVKAGKMGFVNRSGEITIPAQFDFATPFEYGISAYCNDCVSNSDGEHEYFVSGHWGYINYKGEQIQPIPRKVSHKDQKIDSLTHIAYQFAYSPFEQGILAFFQKQSAIAKAHFVNYYSELDSSERQLYFEIVGRPSASFPYYQVAGFSLDNGNYRPSEDLDFLVSVDGRQAYVLHNETKIPFGKWLKNYLADAKLYLEEHPDAPNKF